MVHCPAGDTPFMELPSNSQLCHVTVGNCFGYLEFCGISKKTIFKLAELPGLQEIHISTPYPYSVEPTAVTEKAVRVILRKSANLKNLVMPQPLLVTLDLNAPSQACPK